MLFAVNRSMSAAGFVLKDVTWNSALKHGPAARSKVDPSGSVALPSATDSGKIVPVVRNHWLPSRKRSEDRLRLTRGDEGGLDDRRAGRVAGVIHDRDVELQQAACKGTGCGLVR